ncbi:MAG: purine-binding chemotaxis protein CheW [Nitrospirae bacterium]|nr:purine-binding chemotaxis protein CheW [Nitrospirota bacterium]
MMEPTLEQPQSNAHSEPNQLQSAGLSRICLITLGGESYAIDLRHVREVFELESITPVPGMPASLVGVANLRGTVVPLADLRLPLGLSVSAPAKYAVVVRHGTQQVGVLIDEVPEIRTIHPDDILGVSPGDASRPFLSGLLKIENRTSGVVEVSRLLDSVERTITEPSGAS